jgi:glutaredoxin 3
MRKAVTLYTTRFCPYCVRARRFLDEKGVDFEDIAVDHDPQLRREMTQRSGRFTVPQIWIGEQHIGGCDDLLHLARLGQLDAMLEQARNSL